jgi:hypothetical protein
MEEARIDNKIKILNEKELTEQWNELNHTICCLYQKMSVKFINEHIDDIDWPSLSVNPNLTIEIIDAFPNKISWASICINKKTVSDVILYNYRTKILWGVLLPHQQLNLKLLVVLSEAFRKSRSKVAKMFWKAVSRYQKFDVDYVDTYKRFLDYNDMSYNPYLDDKTIEKYLMKLDAKILLKTRDLSDDILKKHIDYFKSFIRK